MIELLDGMPGHVLGLRLSGQVSDEDYRRVVDPARRDLFAAVKSPSLLLYVPADFRKFTSTAFWDDPDTGLYRTRRLERLAIVTDLNWMRQLAASPAAACEVRSFADGDLVAALNWLA